MTVKLCRRCVMPSSRPRITFDEEGVCNACQFNEDQDTVDWERRTKDLERLIDRTRKHQTYDCIIAFSGGKDSASIAWRVKHDLGLNPLLVCFGQLCWTDVGRRNFDRVCNNGFDIKYERVNQNVSQKLARRFLIERFHIKNHYDAAVSAVPVRAAVDLGIPLVFFAEHGESSYGGHILSEDHRRQRYADEVLENQVGDDARNWATDGITEREIYPYVFPDQAEIDRAGVEAHYWAWYRRWDIVANAKLMEEKVGFEHVLPHSDGSHEGMDSIDDAVDGVDFFGMAVKFGFGRQTRICSRMIQLGYMTRDEGLDLVRQNDGAFPEMYLDEVLNYVGMSRSELVALADRHRNSEIWKQEGGLWSLMHQVV